MKVGPKAYCSRGTGNTTSVRKCGVSFQANVMVFLNCIRYSGKSVQTSSSTLQKQERSEAIGDRHVKGFQGRNK